MKNKEEEGSQGASGRWRRGGGTSGDLPQQRAVNQSDLGRTGTHLVTAPRQHSPRQETTVVEGRGGVRVTRILLGRKDTKRWIDGPGMKRSHEEKANGGGTAE